ncbi:hypothetical protein FHH43_02520 [Clostridium perfringens]|nr:hypothetical protein [Clostridium perfringens]
MKKILISSLIVVAVLSVTYGVKKHFEVKELENKILATNIVNNQTSETINENSNNDEKEESSIVTISNGGYIPNKSEVEEALNHAVKLTKEKGKNPIVVNVDSLDLANRVAIVETKEIIKDIGIQPLEGEYYSTYEMKTYPYLVGINVQGNGNLLKELKPNDVLIFPIHEGDLVATNALYWTDSNGKLGYSDLYLANR